jgi:glycosyltransferase involved in cell wall biosynthesis
MVALAPPRILAPNGLPFNLDPDLDAPLTGPSVLALVGDVSACSLWRVWTPFRRLQLHGYPAEWSFKDHPRLSDYWQSFEAIVLCRLSWVAADRRTGANWFRLLKQSGKKVLYECDDDLFSPFLIEQQRQGIARDKPREVLEQERVAAVWALQQCDGVTVSTQRLATVVRQFTDKPVEVVPNSIDAGWFLGVQAQAKRTVPGLTIGWAGGNRPDSDLAVMAEAWGRIAKRYPAVTFVVQGHQPACVSLHVPEPRIKRLPWLPPASYPEGLVNVDIACCPLEDRHFNRCKTPIKAMEAGLSGSAVVASPTVYRQIVDGTTNGLLADGVEAWEHCLSLLVERDEYRREVAAQLKRDVLARWSLDRHYRRWPESWRRLTEGS